MAVCTGINFNDPSVLSKYRVSKEELVVKLIQFFINEKNIFQKKRLQVYSRNYQQHATKFHTRNRVNHRKWWKSPPSIKTLPYCHLVSVVAKIERKWWKWKKYRKHFQLYQILPSWDTDCIERVKQESKKRGCEVVWRVLSIVERNGIGWELRWNHLCRFHIQQDIN